VISTSIFASPARGLGGCVTNLPAAAAYPPRDLAPHHLARLRAVPLFASGPLDVQDLPGGLTNRILKVTTSDGQRYVARLSNPDASLLAVDRDAEEHDSRAAAAAGVAPEALDRVVDGPSGCGVLVVRWVPARTWTAADLRDEINLRRLAAACRRLHEGPRFARDFDMFALQRRYLAIVRARGFRLPARYEEFLPAADAIRRALAARPVPSVPCNCDLLPANVLDDGERLWIVDYEYAGNADPCFELGNAWSEASLPVELLEPLVTAYFGRSSRAMVARARLLGLMSKYGWTLWASISAAIAEVDFDFWSWGMEKYERAVAGFDGPDLPRLLDEVIRGD
jgi:thiamine kinase-like enzyme